MPLILKIIHLNATCIRRYNDLDTQILKGL